MKYGKRYLNIIAISVSFVAFSASCFVIFYSGDTDDVARQKRIITIPQGQGHAAADLQPIVPIQPDSGKPTPAQNLVEQVRRTYPMLSDVAVRCEADRCALLGAPGRSATPEEQDARQEMLLGGLSSFLAANGYEPSGPIEMDEIGDDEYRIRLPLSRNAQAVAAAGRTSG
ncbi:MAG TPA: hypothetical protein VF489_00615 [Sphingobium sp.]